MSWRTSIQSPWQHLAIAVAGRLEFERECNRGALLNESTVVRYTAEYCQANWNGTINVNFPHPGINRKYIDLTGTMPRSPQIGLAVEAKWIRDGGTRDWIKEVAVDLFRLQHITTNTAQGAVRVILVAGTHSYLRAQLVNRRVRTGGGLVRALPIILPICVTEEFQSFDVRNANLAARQWLRKCQEELGRDLPSTYKAHLSGHYRTGHGDGACEVYIWVTKRPQGWGSFDPNIQWGPAAASP